MGLEDIIEPKEGEMWVLILMTYLSTTTITGYSTIEECQIAQRTVDLIRQQGGAVFCVPASKGAIVTSTWGSKH